jgi:lipopolysaccharide biosynthesis regulator YciM
MAKTEVQTSAAQSPNREELLKMAIRTAQAGNKSAARVMLRRVLSEDKRNERAMMWMAKLADTKSDRAQWLNRVIAVNPKNETARESLKKMQYKRSAKENRTLLTFGVIAGVLLVLGLVIFIYVMTPK